MNQVLGNAILGNTYDSRYDEIVIETVVSTISVIDTQHFAEVRTITAYGLSSLTDTQHYVCSLTNTTSATPTVLETQHYNDVASNFPELWRISIPLVDSQNYIGHLSPDVWFGMSTIYCIDNVSTTPDYLTGLYDCDVCGFTYRKRTLHRRWDNLLVCRECFEEEHSLDVSRRNGYGNFGNKRICSN